VSWSFDPTLAQPKDKVRLLIGDWTASEQFLADETIEAILASYALPATPSLLQLYMPAAVSCEAIAATFARKESQSVVGASVSWSSQHGKFLGLAKQFRKWARNRVRVPTAGGLSIAEREAALLDEDLPRRLFEVGLHDDPEAHADPRALLEAQGGPS
jgi:hypothetical protein